MYSAICQYEVCEPRVDSRNMATAVTAVPAMGNRL